MPECFCRASIHCHPRMIHNMSSPNDPQYVIPERACRGSSVFLSWIPARSMREWQRNFFIHHSPATIHQSPSTILNLGRWT